MQPGAGRPLRAARRVLLSFALQFDPAEISSLATRFGETDDGPVAAAGAAARARGHYARSEFLIVCRWKTARSGPKVASNSTAAIRAATRRAFATEDLVEQISHLLALSGVGLPTGSVLLHFAFPETFPILDVRALESLGVTGRSYTPTFWAAYVTACRELAAATGVSLRTLDKALWQFSKERDDFAPRARSQRP